MQKITIQKIVSNTTLFDFVYPFYKEEKRVTFEQHFIDYFFFDEIGHETIARFKHRLKIKLNLIMPYWNKILEANELEQRILDNYDVKEVYERITSSSSKNENENEVMNTYTSTPTTRVNLGTVDFFDNINKDVGNNKSQLTNEGNEKWSRTMQGNIGVQTDADAIVKYWESLRKIEQEIFEECSDLFMGVY